MREPWRINRRRNSASNWSTVPSAPLTCVGPDLTVDAYFAFDPPPCGLLTAGQRAPTLAVIKTKSSSTSNARRGLPPGGLTPLTFGRFWAKEDRSSRNDLRSSRGELASRADDRSCCSASAGDGVCADQSRSGQVGIANLCGRLCRMPQGPARTG